jgi:alkylation response protein AidB-like acyl-CoA dehydrogenase
LWIIIDGDVYDVTEFQNIHPGGKKILSRVAGTDATKQFHKYHEVAKVLKQVAYKYKIGSLSTNETNAVVPAVTKGLATVETKAAIVGQQLEQFGDMIPYGDPAWYQGYYSPYFNESHVALRAEVRKWVDDNIEPFVDEWDEAGEMPEDVYRKFAKAGYLASLTGLKQFPTQYTDIRLKSVPLDKFDVFHEFVILEELCRCGSGGVIWNLTGGFTIGSPPVFKYAQKAVRDRVVPQILSGNKRICLAITEPEAGSDVANLTTTARKTPDGKYYIVNGAKKWITNGLWADFFTTAVRTGGEGMEGISVLLIERTMPGVAVRKIHTQGMRVSGSSYITFEDVKVPVENLIGKENQGFKTIVTNFNHERLGIIMQAVKFARVCYEESMKYAHKRETFGQKLIEHDVIRNKLAQMASRIEAVQNWLENLVYQCAAMNDQEAMLRLGGSIAGAKALSTQVLEFCAREASQIFGGLSYTKGGRGAKIERIYREVRAYAIPGGSEEIMFDLSIRQALKVHKMMGSKL